MRVSMMRLLKGLSMFPWTNRTGVRELVSGLIVGLLIALVSSVAYASVSSSAAVLAQAKPAATTASPGIVGSWRTAVRRADGTVAAGLLLFTSDGTVTRTSNTPTQGANIGVWSQASDGTYAFTYWAFTFDSDGRWIGSVRTNAALTVNADGNSYDGTFTTYTLDTEENVTQTVPGNVQAIRLQLELPTS